MLCFAESQTFLIRDTIDKKVTSSELSNHQKSLVIRCSLFIDPQTLSRGSGCQINLKCSVQFILDGFLVLIHI